MTDRPIIGQLGRTDAAKTTKVEIIGQLSPEEWREFIECLKECAAKYPKVVIKERTYRVRIRILEKLRVKRPRTR